MDVLVISAHPDDETFGCGGTLLAHRASGDSVYWLIITEPTKPMWTSAQITQEKREIAAVAKALGVKKYWCAGMAPAGLDALPLTELIDAVRKPIEAIHPQVVYSVHHGDVHSDHRKLFEAVGAVLKAFYMKRYGVRRWLAFECLSSTDAASPVPATAFVPNVFRDITPFLRRKLRIVDLYRSQLQPGHLPRSADAVRALARYRGATIGVKYAEAFALVRELT